MWPGILLSYVRATVIKIQESSLFGAFSFGIFGVFEVLFNLEMQRFWPLALKGKLG